MDSRIPALLADDHPLIRRAFRQLLADEPDMIVVGEAPDVEAVRLAHELAPEVVVMDLAMPIKDGVQATTEILHQAPHTAVLAVSMVGGKGEVQKALNAGARGFLLKTALNLPLATAIRDVACGKEVLGPGVPNDVAFHACNHGRL